MSQIDKTGPDRGYWRSLEELGDTPEFRKFAEAEFPAEAQVPTDAVSRRRFLQLMGASVAMAGAAGCRWPEEKILPFAKRPEGTEPGASRAYATTFDLAGDLRPVLVTSHDGRPLKVEGNPDHPLSGGATDVFAQAAVLGLYDPDRSRRPRERRDGRVRDRETTDFTAFADAHFAELRAGRGQRMAVLCEHGTSPTLARLKARFREVFPESGWFEWEPVSRDNERAGSQLAFGRILRTRLHLDAARVVACFDADPLADHPTALRNARDFAAGRRAEDGGMSRLYAVEPSPSLTGAMADHRFALSHGDVGLSVLQLAAELSLHQGLALPGLGGLRDAMAGHEATAPDWIPALARDLMHHRGESLVVAGPRQPDWVQGLVHLLNHALGNAGRTVTHYPSADASRTDHGGSLAFLADLLQRGRIDTLVILGGNPVFASPGDLDFATLIGKAATSLHLSLYDDETSGACTWHVPRAHELESWSDVRDPEGRYGVAQPLIRPLYEGWTPAELVAYLVAGERTSPHDLVRETADIELPAGAWRRVLQRGLHVRTSDPDPVPAPRGGAVAGVVRRAAAARRDPLGPENLELNFHPDRSLFDGRFANNGWLQELPDFMTKLTWDNAALLGVSTAEALGVSHGDLVRLDLDGRSLEMAVYVLPGQAPWTVSVSLGHGRTAAGRVGDGTGFHTYALRPAGRPDAAVGARLVKTGRTHPLATTQDHHAIDATGMAEREKRVHNLVIEGDLAEYEHHPDFVSHRGHHPPLKSLWEERSYEGRAWGMAVDLNACIGCNACVTACQAENNIPVVGKDQVVLGREMHWLRLDRYFQGDPEDPRVAHQPVACVHCEMAPCEQVCPVGATMHSEEGLNVMAYNRCVGTRYCANNCPYKVRRFNFFNNNKDIPEVQKLAYNPEVSLRARGVMEKCTYCVQRIESAKIAAKNAGREVRDGEITTACQQTCPTQAIVFGDLNDPDSEVAKTTANARAYHMLAELNIKPRTAYLARLRNPNPELVESTDGHAAH